MLRHVSKIFFNLREALVKLTTCLLALALPLPLADGWSSLLDWVALGLGSSAERT